MVLSFRFEVIFLDMFVGSLGLESGARVEFSPKTASSQLARSKSLCGEGGSSTRGVFSLELDS